MEQVAQDTQPTTKVKQRLQTALERAERLVRERKTALENIEARERTKQTKTPTKVVNRQKILLGAYVLEKQPQIAKSAEFKVWLTRDGDRAVFGLEPLAKETAQ